MDKFGLFKAGFRFSTNSDSYKYLPVAFITKFSQDQVETLHNLPKTSMITDNKNILRI